MAGILLLVTGVLSFMAAVHWVMSAVKVAAASGRAMSGFCSGLVAVNCFLLSIVVGTAAAAVVVVVVVDGSDGVCCFCCCFFSVVEVVVVVVVGSVVVVAVVVVVVADPDPSFDKPQTESK